MSTPTTNTNQLNLRTLRGLDPGVLKIVYSCKLAAAYSRDEQGEWVPDEIEGPLFVVARKNSPFFQLLILNRKSLRNVTQVLTFDTKGTSYPKSNFATITFDASSKEPSVLGVLLKDHEEVSGLVKFVNGISKVLFDKVQKLRTANKTRTESKAVRVDPQPRQGTQHSSQPATHGNAGGSVVQKQVPQQKAQATPAPQHSTGPQSESPEDGGETGRRIGQSLLTMLGGGSKSQSPPSKSNAKPSQQPSSSGTSQPAPHIPSLDEFRATLRSLVSKDLFVTRLYRAFLAQQMKKHQS